MRSSRSRWLSGIGAAVLIGGLVLASGGSWVTPASAYNSPPPPNPFAQILTKLDEILAAIAAIGGGGGSVDLCHGGTTVGRFVPIGTTEVCDRTTGLTWQKTPDAIPRTHAVAVTYCPTVGTHYRLPEVKELISLLDYSQFNFALPVGHPFTNVQSAYYWSATTYAGNPPAAWGVVFVDGSVVVDDKTNSHSAWCVRGA